MALLEDWEEIPTNKVCIHASEDSTVKSFMMTVDDEIRYLKMKNNYPTILSKLTISLAVYISRTIH